MLEIYGDLPYCLIFENCHVSHEFVSFFSRHDEGAPTWFETVRIIIL